MNPILAYVICAVTGYLCGCFSLSYILAKARGFDIRTRGTNNAGASNAVITLGVKAGVAVGACDIFKAFIPVLVLSLIFSGADYPLVKHITAVSCVIGHMHPFYLKFRGGKGFASYIGATLAINWWFGLLVVAGILLLAFITDYIVSGTFFTITALPLFVWLYDKSWIGAIILAALSLLILIRHYKNIKSIINGTEKSVRESLLKKKPLWKRKKAEK